MLKSRYLLLGPRSDGVAGVAAHPPGPPASRFVVFGQPGIVMS